MEHLHELVKDEADKLKQFATKEELENLDIDELDPECSNTCVYGLLTEDCFSERATELLNLCAIPFSRDTDEILNSGRRPKAFKTHKQDWYFGPRYFRTWFSPIEVYINQEEAKNEHLITYLKGEVGELSL